MRPRGEIREALFEVAEQFAARRCAASWRSLAEGAQVGYDAARRTVENMVRAGELEHVGSEKPEGSAVKIGLYAPVPSDASRLAVQDLAQITQGWIRL